MFWRTPITRRTAAAAAVVLAAGLTGCSTTSESPTSAGSSPAGPHEVDKILFDYPFTALPIFGVLKTSIDEAASASGVSVEYTNDNMDLGTQVTNLTTYLNSDVDAVVSFPADPASIAPIAQQYMSAGKYWVTYGGDLDDQDATLQFSFEKSGSMLGEDAGTWINENLGGQAKVLILEDQTIQLGQERTKGIVEGLAAAAPDAEVVAQQQAITPDQGLSVTSAVLAQHPDVDVVLAAAGDAAQGGYQALLGSGRAADDPNTYVGGLDGNLSLFQQMAAGTSVRGIVTLKTDEIAQAVIDIPQALGRGEEPETDVPVYLVTPSSSDLQDYITAFGG